MVLGTPPPSLASPHPNTQGQMGNVRAGEGGREDGAGHGSLSEASVPSAALPLGSGAFPHPDFPLPTQTRTSATTSVPSVLRGKNIEFCLQSNISEELSLLCISLGRVDPAWGPLFTGAQSTVREIPLPQREAAIAPGGGAQSPEGASPRAPHLPAPRLKHPPRPPHSGERERGEEGHTPAPAPAPTTPRVERSPPGASEPCGSRASRTSRLQRRAGVCKSTSQNSRGQGESRGSPHLPPAPRLFRSTVPRLCPGSPLCFP